MYGSRRLARSYLYGMGPSVQRDLAWRNWRREVMAREIDDYLSPEACREYRSAWEDFFMDHEGAMELPCSVERKKFTNFVNIYFSLTDEDDEGH